MVLTWFNCGRSSGVDRELHTQFVDDVVPIAEGLVLTGNVVSKSRASQIVVFVVVPSRIVADCDASSGPLHEATLVREDCVGVLSISDYNGLVGVAL